MSKDLEPKKDIISIVLQNYKDYEADSSVITAIGQEEIEELKEISSVLESPVNNLMNEKSSAQHLISTNLLSIKTEADKINPDNFNLNPGFLGRIIEKITGSSGLNKYATKYSSVRSVIESISTSLSEGIVLLKSDNFAFNKDKERFRKSADSLKDKIEYLKEISTELDLMIENESDKDKKAFLINKVAFDLNAHIVDLVVIQSAAQQGLMGLDILIQNNNELIKGVNRTKNVAIPVLSIGFTIATGLANQKRVLDTINSVNKTTSDIMVQNAEMLKTQGVEIQKQASSALLDLNGMKAAIGILIESANEVETFRQEALPKMKETIKEFSALSNSIELALK